MYRYSAGPRTYHFNFPQSELPAACAFSHPFLLRLSSPQIRRRKAPFSERSKRGSFLVLRVLNSCPSRWSFPTVQYRLLWEIYLHALQKLRRVPGNRKFSSEHTSPYDTGGHFSLDYLQVLTATVLCGLWDWQHLAVEEYYWFVLPYKKANHLDVFA